MYMYGIHREIKNMHMLLLPEEMLLGSVKWNRLGMVGLLYNLIGAACGTGAS